MRSLLRMARSGPDLLRVITTSVALCAPLQLHAQAHCYDYGAPGIDLSGTLLRRVIPGPPHYSSITTGDRPDTVWVLRLDRTICLRTDTVSQGRSGIKEVRLIVPEEDGSEMRRYTDRHIVFTGKLQRGAVASDPLPIHYWARIFVVDLRDP